MTGIDIAGFTKNQCVCTPEEEWPVNKSVLDENEDDAHIQVAEWRLHKFQSPIELKHEESIHHDHFDPLEFHGHWDEGGKATFNNNGFTGGSDNIDLLKNVIVMKYS